MDIAFDLPKSELHLHLDGSLDPDFIASRAVDRGVQLPVEASKLREYLHVLKSKRSHIGDSVSTNSNWSNFDFCNQFLQTKEELKQATRSLCKKLRDDNVVLAEIRFCPALHTLEGLSVNDVVEGVVSGFQDAEKSYDIKGGIIICALRSYGVSHTCEMVELAASWIGKGVIGFDIAGDEGAFPLNIHEDGIKKAVDVDLPFTLHAGEWPENTVRNIELAVDLGTRRLGHGITLCKDNALMERVASLGITVECCLTSNVGWKVPSYKEHPIRKMFDAGIKVCINSDNLLLSGTNDREAYTSGEVRHLFNDVGFSWDQVRTVLMNGVFASFSPEIDKQWLLDYEAKIEKVLM
ncbi:MAG TPA: adenosine deaminase [Chloroflexi bacterium]|nr:adenosine deaminase [Chloroflexota bacterium]HCU97793.1 adenosine deaminase [Chloroflexota bacterium]|tara:strand:+ start:32 stop:1084 length:1053 start_codon:yes stop_codon:yes gene_type:complete